MATTLTVYAYGNVDALQGIFNAVAMLTTANDFKGMMRIAAVIGFFVAGVVMMFPEHWKRGLRWFMSLAIGCVVAITPKADVQLVDQLGQHPSITPVANVPYVLALAMSVKTAVGSTMTQMFETAFQTIPDPTGRMVLPSELSYIDHGVMFGARLVRISREAEFSSLYTQGDTLNYLRNCIFPSQGRDNLADQIEQSTDLMSIYANPNPALSSSYHDPAQNFTLVYATCDDVYRAIAPLINNDALLAVVRGSKRTFPDVPATTAQSMFENSMMQIYTKGGIAGAATTASEVMLQNIWINATADASALYGASLNDPSLIMFASMRSQAVQQMNAGNLVAGRIAEEALPMIRNVIDAILIAVFPVIVLLAMMSEGQALAATVKGYLLTLFWVELWPPLFAVTNYLQTLEAAKHLAAAGITQTSQGVTLATATGIYSSALSDVAIASYMVTAIPAIAAALVWGMQKITSVAGAMVGSSQAMQEASAGSKGNLSAGNLSLQQQRLAAEQTEPAMNTHVSIGGSDTNNPLTGERTSQQTSSKFVAGLDDMHAVTSQASEGVAKATALAESSQKSYSQARDAAMSEALSFARSSGAGATRSLSFDASKVGSDGLSSEEKSAVSDRLAKQFKVGDKSTVAKALELGLGGGTPASIAGLLKGSLGGKASSVDAEDLAREIATSADVLKQTGNQRTHELTSQVRSGQAFEQARRSNREGAERVESAARKVDAWQTATSAALTESQTAQSDLRKVQAASRTVRTDWGNLIDRYMQSKGLSVHRGVADPLMMQGIVRDVIRSGSVVNIDGQDYWTPEPDPSSQFIKDNFKGLNVSGLRERYAEANPGRGEHAVDERHLVNDGHVRSLQSRNGVRPGQEARGQDLQAQVDAALAGQRAAIGQSEKSTRSTGGQTQLDWDKRTERVSDHHAPVVSSNPINQESVRNKALDGVRGVDGQVKRPFAEAATDAEKEQARRADVLNSKNRPEIPK